MATVASTGQTAKQRAREKILAVQKAAREREARIEAAVTGFYSARDDAAEAAAKLAASEQSQGLFIETILAEGEAAESVAELCDIDQPELRRLSKAAKPAQNGHQ
jgi:hypothetical protein